MGNKNMRDIERYKEQRLIPQIKYYDQKANQNQKKFYLFSVIDLVLTAFIPVVSLSSHNGVAALLGAGATIASGILLLYKHKDLWTKYRFICETLKTYEIKFDNRIGNYSALSDDDAIKLFIESCEQLMANEHDEWQSLYIAPK